MLKRRATLAAFALIAMLAPPAGAQTPPAWTQAGMLKCKLNPSIGFIIAGHQSMECTFVQNGSYSPQAYWGALNMVGLDIGFTAGGVLGWAVLAPTVGIPAGALAANTLAPAATPASASVSEPTSWLVAPGAASHCSRSRWRVRLASMSPSASQRSNCGPPPKATPMDPT